MLSVNVSIYSEMNSTVGWTLAGYANSYLLLIQLSMFSRDASIHSKTNSITKWIPALRLGDAGAYNNYSSLLRCFMFSRGASIYSEVSTSIQWDSLGNNCSFVMFPSMLSRATNIQFELR